MMRLVIREAIKQKAYEAAIAAVGKLYGDHGISFTTERQEVIATAVNAAIDVLERELV